MRESRKTSFFVDKKCATNLCRYTKTDVTEKATGGNMKNLPTFSQIFDKQRHLLQYVPTPQSAQTKTHQQPLSLSQKSII